MSIKSFFLKKMIASKMKNVPQAQQDQMIGMIEKNPELFKKIAEEIQEKVKGGKDQMAATMEVAQKYQDQLKGLM